MSKLFETMKDTVGIDMAEIVKAGTYDAKVNRNININGASEEETARLARAVETAAAVDSIRE